MNSDDIDCCWLGWIDSDDYYHGDDNDDIDYDYQSFITMSCYHLS